MEAKDLRIGNYVSVDECSTWAITELDIVAVCTFKGSHKPIPLTEEWLVKFGFFEKYKSCFNRWNIKGFSLNDNEDRNGDLQGVFIYDYKLEVSYVHQLQNLYFALTGEELETTN